LRWRGWGVESRRNHFFHSHLTNKPFSNKIIIGESEWLTEDEMSHSVRGLFALRSKQSSQNYELRIGNWTWHIFFHKIWVICWAISDKFRANSSIILRIERHSTKRLHNYILKAVQHPLNPGIILKNPTMSMKTVWWNQI
jgi:hypothetical protein